MANIWHPATPQEKTRAVRAERNALIDDRDDFGLDGCISRFENAVV
ncbi:hypothetical protein [Oleiharenicola sp. Vm1]